ncbi:unnamed protein product [Calypogeia fissa]
MALVCTSCHVGHVRSTRSDIKVSDVCSGVPSICHVVIIRLPNMSSQAACSTNLGWRKTTRVWDHSRDVCRLKPNRECPQWYRQWRVALSSSADNPIGVNGEGPGNGGIRTVAVNHFEKGNCSLDDDTERKFPARVTERSDSIKPKDVSRGGPAHSLIGGNVTMSAEIEEMSSYDLSDLSAVPESGTSRNFQENSLERDKEFSEAEEENFVSYIWEAGLEIEKITPERGSLKDRNDTEDKMLAFTVEEERRRQKEPLLGVKVSEQVSNLGAQWLDQRPAIERPIWVSREEKAFYEFFENLSKIQQKIGFMMVIQGKLAWIRLQQLLARRLRALQGILANFPESENELNAREAELLAFADKLMNQSAVHEDAYRRSQEALRAAERMVLQLKTRVNQLTEDVASRDALLRLLQKEASVSFESLQKAGQSLSEAERRIMTLERRVQTGEEALGEERDKVSAAIKSAGSLEEAARVAENKISELTSEISTLKAFAATSKKAENLSAQVKAFEQELRSRDSLLLEIKGEIKRRTEALTVASQIKQDLDAARHREVQLAQALESANNLVKELQTEVVKNARSLRAEQALKQMEKMLRDSNLEVKLLRKGVEERDKSIHLMKDEVDLNIGILNNAARDREELRKIKLQMKDLKAELGSKDTKLKIMREEMASVINLARQKSTSSGTSSSDHISASAAESNPAVQMSKPKKKRQQIKKTGSLQKSVSSPHCP